MLLGDKFVLLISIPSAPSLSCPAGSLLPPAPIVPLAPLSPSPSRSPGPTCNLLLFLEPFAEDVGDDGAPSSPSPLSFLGVRVLFLCREFRDRFPDARTSSGAPLTELPAPSTPPEVTRTDLSAVLPPTGLAHSLLLPIGLGTMSSCPPISPRPPPGTLPRSPTPPVVPSLMLVMLDPVGSTACVRRRCSSVNLLLSDKACGKTVHSYPLFSSEIRWDANLEQNDCFREEHIENWFPGKLTLAIYMLTTWTVSPGAKARCRHFSRRILTESGYKTNPWLPASPGVQ